MEDSKVLKGYIISYQVGETEVKNIFFAGYTYRNAMDLFYRWYDTQYDERPLNVFINQKRFKKAQKTIYNEDYMKRQLEHIEKLERGKKQ